MENTFELPEGYSELLQVDLQKDKRLMLLVNGISLLIVIIMIVIANSKIPITTLYDFDINQNIVRLILLLVGMIGYIILHELVHGIFIRYFSGKKASYGFTALYAYAGSKAYFNKRSYIIIAIAPIVIWGTVLLILNCIVSKQWFWVVYIIQVVNISGAAGDLYVTWRFSNMPDDILIQDTGVAMTVYSKH